MRARFIREVKIQSVLGGPFVIPVLAHDLTGPDPWYVMPLAVRSYHEQLVGELRSGAITHEPLADILNALDYIHRRGYAHRDLKPRNVLLHDGKWKLSDFGLAVPPTGSTTRFTSADSAWGTIAYMAPEQARAFGRTGPAADIYAFGCILHDAYAHGDVRPPLGKATAPGAIGRIIEKCTELTPTKRFPSVAMLRSALLTALSTSSPSAVASTQEVQWLAELPAVATWDSAKTDEFCRYLEAAVPSGEKDPIFSVLDEVALAVLMKKDQSTADAIAELYCNWVKGTGFTFSFCDVIVHRVYSVFMHGSLAAQGYAALAAAELGYSHNRWYVMSVHLDACGPSLPPDIAERIALEIEIEGAHRAFIACAEQLHGKSIYNYHPTISAVLLSYKERGH